MNRPLEREFAKSFGENFNLGGLAGFPFSGVTGFQAMMAHIPDGSSVGGACSCLVVYGSHCGVDADGNVGKINRRGKSKPSSCCGSAVVAANFYLSGDGGRRSDRQIQSELRRLERLDAQQAYVNRMLRPHVEQLSKADDAMVELPYCIFEEQDKAMREIVSVCLEGGGGGGGKVSPTVALLGGIQINTPKGQPDWFLPLRFDIRDGKTGAVTGILSSL